MAVMSGGLYFGALPSASLQSTDDADKAGFDRFFKVRSAFRWFHEKDIPKIVHA